MEEAEQAAEEAFPAMVLGGREGRQNQPAQCPRWATGATAAPTGSPGQKDSLPSRRPRTQRGTQEQKTVFREGQAPSPPGREEGWREGQVGNPRPTSPLGLRHHLQKSALGEGLFKGRLAHVHP